MHKQAVEYSVLQSFYESLDCSKSLMASLLLKYNQIDDLVRLEFDPVHYNDLSTASNSLQAVKYASKFTFTESTIDPYKVAIESFKQSERNCAIINERFRFGSNFSCADATLLYRVQRKISSILGDFDIDYTLDHCNWGPGVTTSLKGDRATVANKFHHETTITPQCYLFFRKIFRAAYPSWAMHIDSSKGFEFRTTNKTITVPKNSKTDRTISVEPGVNLWFQKGIGSLIRSRLLSRGAINLRDQGHNQRLARIGSKFNNLATIDFSAASDSIATNVILQLIPEEWLSYMMACRSPCGELDGQKFTYEKFSSMGNGFTFELESLLFFAIASAICDPNDKGDQIISIYGDDLVIPSEFVEQCTTAFSFFGFSINKSKSYSSSYYRESCGMHYWGGSNITPIFLRENLRDINSCLKAANSIRMLAHRRNVYGCDATLKPCWDLVVSLCKKFSEKIFKIPFGIGDGGLISNFDESTPSRARFGMEGYVVRHSVFIPYKRCRYDFGLLLGNLKQCVKERAHHNDEDVPRRGRYRDGKAIVASWYDLGPWS